MNTSENESTETNLVTTTQRRDNKIPKPTLMYAEILLPVNIGREMPQLTYKVPSSLTHDLAPGSAVRVSLRNRTYTGIVTELHERSLTFTAKEILASKAGGQILATWQLELARWIANHYAAPFHKVLKMFLPHNLWGRKTGIPRQLIYARTDQPIEGKMGTKQSELIKLFDQEKYRTRDELSAFSLATIKGLITKGLLQETHGDIMGSRITNDSLVYDAKTLTQDQAKIVNTILTSNDKKFLLHGVTGSGKTEIYLRIAEAMIEQGKQCTLLVPEISLTPQLIGYFSARFGNRIAVMHSKLSQGEHEREWWRIQQKEALIVIGSRSAIFSPTHAPGVIILDEEHEWTYKQDQSPFYHARNVAFKLSELTGAKVILGSATPDVETTHAAETGTLTKLTLNTRLNASNELPPVILADMRAELQKGNFSIFSETLIESLEKTIASKEQAILFLNRRGHASSILCRECGLVAECTQCDVSLTYHRFKNGMERLVCHHCGLTQTMPDACSQCGGLSIKFIGLGTQRVEEELHRRFPTARILRADRDTTSQKDSFETMYNTFKKGEADLLIGTQMISKGLDLPNVTLVGVMLADIGLHIPDFRAGEHVFQLLTQVAGRAGRDQKPGHVIIQTYNPEHPSLVAAAHHDYAAFYEQEIAQRKAHGNPPFSRIIKITFKDAEQKKCTNEVHRIESLLKPHLGTHRLTMAPALITRKHNKYRWHLFLQGDSPHLPLEKIRNNLGSGWSIDVDPMIMS